MPECTGATMLTIKQLSYALAAEKTLNFKKAAALCHVSQSSFSTGLNELEKQLGIQIFERDNKKVLVTPLGREVLNKARDILFHVDELIHLADNQQQSLYFPLSIGVIPTIAPYLLPRLLPKVKQHYPDAELHIIEEQSHLLVDMVSQGEIDAAILALPFPCKGLLSLEFWQEDFHWVARKGEEHTQQREVTTEELIHSNLMLLKDGHCLKDHILNVCRLSEQTANQGYGATSLTTLIQMVNCNMGTTLIPEMALEQLITQNSALSTVHLNEPGPHRRIAIVFRPNYARLSDLQILADIGKQALSQG